MLSRQSKVTIVNLIYDTYTYANTQYNCMALLERYIYMKYAKSECFKVETHPTHVWTYFLFVLFVLQKLLYLKRRVRRKSYQYFILWPAFVYVYLLFFIYESIKALYIKTKTCNSICFQTVSCWIYIYVYMCIIICVGYRSEIEYKSYFGCIKIWKLHSLLRILYTKNTDDNTTVEIFSRTLRFQTSMQHQVFYLVSDYNIIYTPPNTMVLRPNSKRIDVDESHNVYIWK